MPFILRALPNVSLPIIWVLFNPQGMLTLYIYPCCSSHYMHNAIIKFSNSEPVFKIKAYSLTSISTPAGKSNLLNSSVVC